MVYIFSSFIIGNGKKNEDGVWEKEWIFGIQFLRRESITVQS